MIKRARISKTNSVVFYPFSINTYMYLNSIFVYYALQLHLRESKPNLCITLEFCAAPDGSHQLSQEAKLTPCTSVNDWDWTEPLADRWFIIQTTKHQTKPQLILSIYCLCLLLFSFNFFLIARMCVWPTTCVGLKKR